MKRNLAFLLPVVGLVALATTLSCAPTVQQVQFKYAEKRATLPNGLKLVVIPDSNTPMVQVNVRYEVGSNEDPEGKRGLAHFVEHMMFQHRFLGPDGPPTFEMLPVISPGGYNAYTDWEKTHYWLTARGEDVEGLLRLEAGRLNAGCDTIPEAEFVREREVVRNEIRQRTGGAPGQVLKLLLAAAYPENHAYHEYVGGDDKQLSNIEFKDVCKFFDDYYAPDRATVIVIGNVDAVGGVDAIGKMVAKNFGGITKKAKAPRREVTQLPPFEKYEQIEHKVDIERSELAVIWRVPPLVGDKKTAMNILVGTMNARLNRLRSEWKFAASISASFWDAGGRGGPVYSPIIIVQAELYKRGDLDKALGYIWDVANDAHKGVSGEGLDDRSKNLSKASAILSLESLGGRANFIADLIQFETDVKFKGNKEYLFAELEKIDKMDAGSLRGHAEGLLSKSHARVVVFTADPNGLKGDTRSSVSFSANPYERENDKPVDVKEALKPLPAPRTKSILGKAETYTLGNGMKVILLPIEGSMPVVTASLMFRAGAAQESADDAGLANLAAGFRGPPQDANFWQTGVQFGGFSDSDATYFQSRGLSIYLDIIVKGLERIAGPAGYVDQDSIERWQKRAKDRFKSERFRQQESFNFEFRSALFGPEHPYTTNADVTEKSIGRMGRDKLNGFARKHFSAGNATLILAGGFDPVKAKSEISDVFGSWGKGHVDEPVSAAIPERSGPVHFGVIGKEHPQVIVRIAFPGPAGIDDRYAARQVLSRMINKRMGRVRAELGSTYGVNGGWQASVGPSAYFIQGGIDKTRAGESLAFMRRMLQELRDGNGLEKDFAEARRATLKSLLAESTESFSLVSRLGNAALFGQPPDAYDTLVKQVAALSIEAVKQLVKEELDPNLEIIGALGDREALETMFSKAGLNSARFIEPK